MIATDKPFHPLCVHMCTGRDVPSVSPTCTNADNETPAPRSPCIFITIVPGDEGQPSSPTSSIVNIKTPAVCLIHLRNAPSGYRNGGWRAVSSKGKRTRSLISEPNQLFQTLNTLFLFIRSIHPDGNYTTVRKYLDTCLPLTRYNLIARLWPGDLYRLSFFVLLSFFLFNCRCFFILHAVVHSDGIA